MSSHKSPKFQPIAVVGVSALFPGSTTTEGFWQDILAGTDLVQDVPETHWKIDDYYDKNPKAPDKTYARRGAFLKDVDFDSLGWGVPPSLLSATDTSQLLALIVAQRVLADAIRGQFAELDRSKVSVILGVTSAQELLGSMVSRLQRPIWAKSLREAGLSDAQTTEICDRISAHYAPWQEATFPGLLGNVVAGRIANRLDLGGTNCVTDAACASTFSALAMAVGELQLGTSDLVISGGVDTLNDIFMYMCFSKTPALSPTGDCRPFSSEGDGTILGEGLGMVALKRLEDALADGDRVYAVIRGVGTSSDGRSKSIYAPVAKGQSVALGRAYEQAGYSPRSVELIEAHGTGTKAGDAAEFSGLSLAFAAAQEETGDRQWCALGSVKSQVGHTKAAAGAAGLLKAIFALHHKVLPQTIKVEQPNPQLELEQSPFYISTQSRPWVRDPSQPRRAGVSSFGFGGSNFHITLEEAPAASVEDSCARERMWGTQAQLVTLSATSASQLSDKLQAFVDAAGSAPMLAYLAQAARASFDSEMPFRIGFLWSQDKPVADLLKPALRRIAEAPQEGFRLPNGVAYGVGEGGHSVAMLFPGQGSQYVGMGRELAMHFDAARRPWDALVGGKLPAGPEIARKVFPTPSFQSDGPAQQTAALTATEVAQPALGNTSLATLGLLQQMGVQAQCYGGHSYGELVALHAAGCYDEQALLSLSRSRGELMAEAAKAPGAMLAVSASRQEVEKQLQGRSGVGVANHNHPKQVVVSGEEQAVEELAQALKQAGIRASRLQVATAFHSPIVAPACEPFAKRLAAAHMEAPQTPVFANSTAEAYGPELAQLRTCLAEQIRKPVRFVEMIEAMYDSGARIFVEVGAGTVLTGLAGKILKGKPGVRCIATDPRKDGSLFGWLQCLCQLAAEGVALRPADLYQEYRSVADPRSLPKPKLAVAINGTNYGKPYPHREAKFAPPKASFKTLPPKPRASGASSGVSSRRAEPTAVPSAPQPPKSAKPTVTAAPTTTREPSLARATAHTQVARVQLGQQSAAEPKRARGDASPSARPAPARSADAATAPLTPAGERQPAAAPPWAISNEWLAVYEETQAQILKAQQASQSALTRSHEAFLRTAQEGFAFLSQVATGAAPGVERVATEQAHQQHAQVQPEPVPAAAAVPMSQASVPPMPQEVQRAPAVQSVRFEPPATPKARPVASLQHRERTSEAAPKPAAVEQIMLAVVAEKTGYPAEMLELTMTLEGDLGIDSIKRVEILSAVQERAPGLGDVDGGALGKLQTLGEIVAYLRTAGGNQPEAAAPAKQAQAPGNNPAKLEGIMLAVVGEKTGYPAEMLELSMSLEGDLGIDSIKRVEILSAVQERAPGLGDVDGGALGKLQTLGEIVSYLRQVSGDRDAGSTAAPESPVTQAIGAAAIANGELEATMLRVVGEKTGYPAEMLELSMSLEGDLGIDSIKRVEILSAVQEQAPGLGDVDGGALGKLQTLGEIVAYLREVSGAAVPSSGGTIIQGTNGRASVNAAPATAPPAASTAAIETTMLSVVADKTGYPAEMLELSMSLEGDLGIDSIKRVEILSAVQEREPGLGEVDGGALAKLQTLGEIVAYLRQASGGEALAQESAAAPEASPINGAELEACMLAVVAEKTGYPAEMLELSMSLEGDLGIDSIKRVEILSAVQERQPGLGEVDGGALAKLQTLGEIVAYLRQPQVGGAADSAAQLAEPHPGQAADADVPRFGLGEVAASVPGLSLPRLYATTLWIVDGASGLAETLAERLKTRGVDARACTALPASADAVVSLHGLAAELDAEGATQALKSAFGMARQLANQSTQPVAVFAFGTGRSNAGTWAEHPDVLLSGLGALARTAQAEWQDGFAKAVEVSLQATSGDGSAPAACERLLAELEGGGLDAEVRFAADGVRWLPQSQPAPYAPSSPAIAGGDVVVVSGGAKGVTAQCLVEWARSFPAHFVLLGRSQVIDEPNWAAGASDVAGLTAALLTDAKRTGTRLSPRDVRAKAWQVLGSREIRQTLDALRAAGAQAEYVSVDVSSKADLCSVLDDVRNRLGPIRGVVHGAGVLADKTIAEKTDEQFARVFGTKVAGLQALASATLSDPLRLFCCFSSVAGRTGNQGQCDYAMANRILARAMVALGSQGRQDLRCVSLGWGPWDGGMVTPALRAQFESQGIPTISLQAGADAFVKEMSDGGQHGDLVLGDLAAFAARPGASSLRSMALRVSSETHGYLADHAIGGVPVVPVALAMEWFARYVEQTAQQANPHLHLVGLEQVQVVRGIHLTDFADNPLVLYLEGERLSEGDRPRFELKLRAADGTLHYRAQAELCSEAASPSIAPPAMDGSETQLAAPIYGSVLFHERSFQVITGVDGVSQTGIRGRLKGVRQADWRQEPWKLDVAAIDGALQLALLYGEHVLAAPTLPTEIGQFRSFGAGPVEGEVTCHATGRHVLGSKTITDMVFQDEAGNTVAELLGVQTHRVPSQNAPARSSNSQGAE